MLYLVKSVDTKTSKVFAFIMRDGSTSVSTINK